MTLRCKFVDAQGEPIGCAEVPPIYGVVSVDGRFYGRMHNGDEDRTKFPFIFAESEVIVLAQLEELKYEHEKRNRPNEARRGQLPGNGEPARIGNSSDRPERVLRQRRDQLKKNRGRNR